MKYFGRFLGLLFCICLLTNYNNLSTTKHNDYFFEPDISTISGTLKTELYYPEADSNSKAYPYIFYPDDTINVIQKSDSSDFDKTTMAVTKFQLAPMRQVSLHEFVNKRLKITGRFYGQNNALHFTKVLMTVEKVEKL